MNRFLLFVVVFLLNFVSFAQEKRSTFIKEQPLPMKVVNDFGKFLTKPEKDHLEKNLIAFRERKGYSVVIITLPGLTDNKGTEFTIEETAQLYFNRWGIGDNVKNDGVLILLSKQPRRIRIHTGSGMRTLLTDGNCAGIISQTMVPNFKADLYFTGLKDAVKDIENRIDENEALNKPQTVAGSSATTETQPAYTSQGVAQPEEGMTFGKFMYAFITLVTLAWLYFRYRLRKAGIGRPAVYSGGGYESGGT
ncbi:MAG TPA: TPM domain-containing protein, partial [Niastella sp.]